MACVTCRKPIAGDAVVCNGGGHPHHARCAERVGMCEVAGCRAIGFRAADEAPAPAPVVRAAPGEPVGIPAPWDGACVYCPACHGVSPWPAEGCCYCDASLADHARRDPAWLARCIAPYPPPGVRAVSVGVRFLAILHVIFGAALCWLAWAATAATVPVHGDIGEPAEIELWPWLMRRAAFCFGMALALRWVGGGIERGSRVALVMLGLGCAWLVKTLFGLPIAAMLAGPLLTSASRRFFRRCA